MSNDPNTQAPAAYTEMFSPFDADGILCVQDGKITTDPDEQGEWTEYHLERNLADIWRIERCDADEVCFVVYEGRIPDRAFFVALMNNQEVPLPTGWQGPTAEDRGREMMMTPMCELPPIALDFANLLRREQGMCGKVLLTAWIVYAQCVENLPCTDDLYRAKKRDIEWFKNWTPKPTPAQTDEPS